MYNYARGGYEPGRYRVLKRNATGEYIEVPGATYFVLRIDQDPHARKALETYALSVTQDNPTLTDDLWKLLQNVKLKKWRNKNAKQ
jgi:hypothetical protein